MIVYKYVFELTSDEQTFWMMKGGEIILCKMQRGVLCLWVLARPSMEVKHRTFRVFGTGHDIPNGWCHVGSCLSDVHELVWHVFEKVTAEVSDG